MEEVNFIVQNKKKRNRFAGSHRWTDKETCHLIDGLLESLENEPDGFEKPTSEKFYTKLHDKDPILQNLTWKVMKSKVRHLKATYFTALKWKIETGEQKGLTKRTLRICPHFEKLQQIFGNVEINHFSRTSKIFSNDSNDAMENPLLLNGIMKQELSVEDFSSVEDSTNFDSNIIEPTELDHETMEENKKNENRNIQEKELEIKLRKFEFEREMAEQELEFKKAQLEQEMEICKLHIEKEERLLILKLESDEKMQKLKIDSEERLKKLELELKYK